MDEHNRVMGMIRILLLGLCIVVLTGAWCQHSHKCHQPIHQIIVEPNDIPSVREIQQRLKATEIARYDPGPIDGRLGGPDSLTRTAWEYYTCDQYAKVEFENVRSTKNTGRAVR